MKWNEKSDLDTIGVVGQGFAFTNFTTLIK